MNAFVFGGYHAQMRGKWAKALRDSCGINVVHAACADDEFRGMPTESLPKGVDLVLVVVGSCSHNVSERAKSLAWRAGIRCETVSKDVSRTIGWLQGRGYTSQITDKVEEAPDEVPVARGQGVLVTDDVGNVEPLVSEPEWLDRSQIKQLLPDLSDQQFYNLVKVAVPREPRKDRRLMPTTDYRTGNVRRVLREVQVWTMDEVLEIENMAKSQGVIKAKAIEPPAVELGVSIPLAKVIELPVVEVPFERIKPFELAPIDDTDWLIKTLRRVTEELAAAATRERDEWRAKCEVALAERDALKAQLERIKSALGV